MKSISNIIREFDKSTYKSYERRRPKHKTTGSYFYLVRQLTKCMMRDDALNLYVYPVRTEMNVTQQILISHFYSKDDSESEEFLVDKSLSQVCSTDEDKLKIIIAGEISTEESESECSHKSINKEKDAKNEEDNEEPTVTDNPVVKEPGYFNIFACGNNLLNKIDATYEQA